MVEHNKYDYLKLKNHFCFPLYAAARETIKLYTPFLEQIDMTYTQYIAMTLLWEHKTLTVKEMGEYLFLDSGTLTPLLKKLESKGLVTRARSTKDERNLNVTITEEGEAMRDRVLDVPLSMGKYNPLTMEETVTMYRLLYKMLGQEDVDPPDWSVWTEKES